MAEEVLVAEADAQEEGQTEAMTNERSMEDFRRCYQAKKGLIDREREDFRFALGEQWSDEDKEKLRAAGYQPFTDNRIQPNLFLLTGLERQNRTDFKAFPEGEEDSLKAEIATMLLKHAIKRSSFQYKSSDQFKDGITCGESHLEFYLDYTDNLLNGKPCWRKCDGRNLFPGETSREYDWNDARYIYKVTYEISREDLINLFPKKRGLILKHKSGKLDPATMLSGGPVVERDKDYPTGGSTGEHRDLRADGFDLIERYYKKYVECAYVGDHKTGDVTKAESPERAQAFLDEYSQGIERDQQAYEAAVAQLVESVGPSMAVSAGVDPMTGQESFTYDPAAVRAQLEAAGKLPPAPPARDPGRFEIIMRHVPEIWCYAHVPGIPEALADERAWSYPQCKSYPFAPFYGRFSTAPLDGEDRHLLVQGVVHPVKGAQERHNKAEMLKMRHLNASANSGWIAEEDSWVDPKKVQEFGSRPGVNLEYKAGKQRPERIHPAPMSQGHEQLSITSVEAIKGSLGINADLLATQQGGTDSGRAIALRQRQGLLMVQELFDNLSRTRQIAGQIILSQLGKMYDTATAAKVLGDSFMAKNFPLQPIVNPMTGQPELPRDPETGRGLAYDKQAAEIVIAEVLTGDLADYDVAVGESVASETQRMANSAELAELAAKMPVPPTLLVRHSGLPESTKTELLTAYKQQAQPLPLPMPGAPKPPAAPGPLGAAE